MLIQDYNYVEALKTIDKAIDAFKLADEKLYATTIYRLFKQKADLYKRNGDFEKFDEFWFKAGMRFPKTEELKKLSRSDFPREQWHTLMQENVERYLYLQDFLMSYGIYP